MIGLIPEVWPTDDMGAAFVYAIWLRVETESGRIVFRQCHSYIVNTENNLDLFKVSSSGRLERCGYLNNVRTVEEVLGPPGPPRVEAPPEPAAVVADDDIPL